MQTPLPGTAEPSPAAGVHGWTRAFPAALALALVALSTGAVALLTPSVPVRSAGVFYLVAVLAVSSLCGLAWGLATALLSAAAFNFFFLPPVHTFRLTTSGDWLVLGAFALTAVVTSELSRRAGRQAHEAARRAREAELGERFATLLAEGPSLEAALVELGRQAARALGAVDGRIDRGSPSPPSPQVIPLELGQRRLGELRLSGGGGDAAAGARVARTLAGLIALGEERDRRIAEQVGAAALERSDELKTALLRAVSHDLRSPLMAIATAAGGLRFADLDDDDRELVETITGESERLRRMVDKLLDLSRLEAGALGRRHDWIDLRDVVEAAAAEVGAGGDRMALDIGSGAALVRADASQLERVLVNLMENAVKFSQARIEVRVRRCESSFEVVVADHGPGIDGPDAERIFEPFYRSPGVPTVPGSGLGLAIARGLAVANGGTLSVEGQAGAGSTFVLSVPAPSPGRR